MYRDLSRKIDRFFAGYWFWRLRLWSAERQIGVAMIRYGDLSMEARKATEQFKRVRFAVQFGRMAPSWERVAVRKALHAGFHREDVRLVVLNRDFMQSGGKLSVRRSFLVGALAWTLTVVPFIEWVFLCWLTVTGSGEAGMKTMIVVVSTMAYWVLGRGLSLFTTRPVAAGKRLATKLRMDPIETQNADVLPLRMRVNASTSCR